MTVITDLDRQRMDEITAGLPTKSEKIRRLAAAGFERADIARYLDIRYQHVRNVLTGPQPKRAKGEKARAESAMPERNVAAAAGEGQKWVWTTVGKNGRIDLPATFLHAIGVTEGDSIQLSVDRDVLRILPRDAVIREMQSYVRRYISDNVSLVDELLDERRAEAAREREDAGD